MRYLIFTGGKENPLFDILFEDLKDREDVVLEAALPVLPSDPAYRFFHSRTMNRKRPALPRFLWNGLSKGFEAGIERELDKGDGLWLVFNNFSVSYFEPSVLDSWKKRYGIKLGICFFDRADSYYAAEAKLYTGCVDFDAVFTYHRPDVEKYGFRYFDCYYSKTGSEGAAEHSDVFFWGSDGDRRSFVEAAYRRLTDMGYKADFGICYPLGEGRMDGITYDVELGYEEIVSRSISARVILDVVRPDSQGVSLRYYEAIVYGKKLISNNPLIRDMRFFNPSQILLIEKPEDISKSFMEAAYTPAAYGGEFSPLHFLELLKEV